ncbi:hypothetical protein AB6C40_24975 [Vibrio splendidus]
MEKTKQMRRTATMYFGVSERLFATGNGDDGWVGALNAALSIEIFIKSQLEYTGKCVPKKHGLLSLFKRLNGKDQIRLVDEYREASEGTQLSGDLIDDLKKFNHLFVKARYVYDPNAIGSTGNDVFLCAKILRDVIYSMQGRG